MSINCSTIAGESTATNDQQEVEIEVAKVQRNTRRLHRQWTDNLTISHLRSFDRRRDFQNDHQARDIGALWMNLQKPVSDPCKFAKCIEITSLVIQYLQNTIPKEPRILNRGPFARSAAKLTRRGSMVLLITRSVASYKVKNNRFARTI
jgi:hypothetical protein